MKRLPESWNDQDDPLRGYYFGFKSTGVAPVDAILMAISAAGNMYHNTESWGDDDFDVGSCTDWIQAAANDAAKEFRKTQAVKGEQ